MQKRRSVLGVGVRLGLVLGTLAMASGCVAPPDTQETAAESESDGETGTVSQAETTATCNYAANGQGTAGLKEAQKRGLQALKYILGGNNISGCNGFKAQANVVRTAIKNGSFDVTNSSSSIICGIPAKRIRVTEQATQTTRTTGPVWNALHNMVTSGGIVDQCFGIGASTFFILQTNATYNSSTGRYTNWVEFDPSPATLTANLTGTATGTSAYAAAKYSDDSVTNVFRWSGGKSCTSAHAGLSCTTLTGTVNSGTEHVKSLVNFDGTCYCY